MHARLSLVAAAVLLAVLLAGCGEGSSTPSSSTAAASGASSAGSAQSSKSKASTAVPNSPAVSAPASAATVASVAGVPISKSSYAHWLTVETKLGGSANASGRALAFLLTSQWVVAEAKARGVSVSTAEVERRYRELVHQGFPKAGALQKYFATSGETEADILARVKVELLIARIAAQVTAGKSAAQRKAVLGGFQNEFHARWKAQTSCQRGYVMEDCKQSSGKT